MKLIDISQLSEMINVKKKTIYDWVHKGMIPYFKLGQLIRFNSDDIDKWLKSRKRKPWFGMHMGSNLHSSQ